jgi:hypothetical protein
MCTFSTNPAPCQTLHNLVGFGGVEPRAAAGMGLQPIASPLKPYDETQIGREVAVLIPIELLTLSPVFKTGLQTSAKTSPYIWYAWWESNPHNSRT